MWRGVCGVMAVTAAVVALTLPSQAQSVDGQVAVVEASVSDSGDWSSWFGAPAERTLRLTIDNPGELTLADAPIVVRVGKGTADEIVASTLLDTIDPGTRATYEIDFALPRFAYGTYEIEGLIGGVDRPIEFATSTAHVPWALAALPLLILAIVALSALQWLLRRRANRLPDEPHPWIVAAGAEPLTSEPVEPTTIDLRGPAADRAGVAAVIEAELDAALADLRLQTGGAADREAVAEWRAQLATERLIARLDLDPATAVRMTPQLTRALLERSETQPSA